MWDFEGSPKVSNGVHWNSVKNFGNLQKSYTYNRTNNQPLHLANIKISSIGSKKNFRLPEKFHRL